MKRVAVLLAAACLSATGAPALADTGPALVGPAVTVGANGNEPNLAVAPDGTTYLSALQYLYASTDDGATWREVPKSVQQQATVASDSSVAVDPGGRLYFAVNYPYAGTVSVCTSDDRAATPLTCDPSTVPGGNDRQWLTAPTTSASYLTTNEGLYQTVFATSTDRGATYVPGGTTTTSALNPNDGPPRLRPQDGLVYQPYVNAASNQTATDNELSGPLMVHVWDPQHPTQPKAELATPLQAGTAITNLEVTPDGALWMVSENPLGPPAAPTGKDVVVARSTDGGASWTTLPPLPGTTTGTSAFSWLAVGRDGHLGVVYYRTDAGGRADTATGSWSAYWAETTNANDPAPVWRTQLLESHVHDGHLCTTAGCLNSDRFAGDFLGAAFDRQDRAHVAWMRQTATGTQVRFAGPAGLDVPAPVVPEAPLAALLPVAAVALLAGLVVVGRRRRDRGPRAAS